MSELLATLLSASVATCPAHSVGEWWAQTQALRSTWQTPVDAAWAGGFASDRVAYAFVAGYQAALRRLVAELPPALLVSFCATEEEGNRPRHIRTRLTRGGDGAQRLDGSKRWSTLALDAALLLVVASEGSDADGRNRLRLVRVASGAPGLTVEEMSGPSFMPEVRHGRLELRGVVASDDAVLEGDGYERYVKPFRSAEDLCVNAALLGYQLSVARRHGWPKAELERLALLRSASVALAAMDLGAAETHVALAGWLAAATAFAVDTQPLWQSVGEDERLRWERDRRLAQVAGRARDMRRERAWALLGRPDG